jgi:capsular exopolysaccharide synthesis family protein
MKVEIRNVLSLARKWLRLLLLACLLGGAVGFVFGLLQPKTYQGETTLYVSSPNHIDYNTVVGDQQAAKAFALFPQSSSILEAALKKVDDKSLSLTQLKSMVSVQNDLDSQFVIIRVRSSDPKLATQLVAAIAAQSMAQFEASVSDGGKMQFLQDEVVKLGTEIKNLEVLLTTVQGRGTSFNDPATQAARISEIKDELSGLRQLYIELVTTETTSGATSFLLDQVNRVQAEITSLENILTSLQQGQGTSSNDPTVQAAYINQLKDELSGLRQLYIQLVTSYGNLTSPQVTILQPAQVPDKPVGPGPVLAAALGMLAGLVAILGVIVFIEQTDDVLRTPAKVAKATGLPTFITVKYLPEVAGQTSWLNGHQPGAGVTVTVKPVTALIRPASSLESKYRMMEESAKRLAVMTKQAPHTVNMRLTNRAVWGFELPESFLTLGVLLNRDSKQEDSSASYRRSLLITSPENGDGKTLIASQIALGLARIGVKVVLVDSNLRNPHIHRLFGISNQTGLSTILSPDNNGAGQVADSIFSVLQQTPEPNLTILPGGPPIDSAPTLLSSSRMGDILQQLSQNAFVVIDGPAVLTASDAMILASKSDGILMVVNACHTTAVKLNQSLEMLSRLHVPVHGVVLNRVGKQNEV